ncbi:unnamed protein product [Trichogramma brassicae]|uniref:Uncharacterized protein n=1 Tax=Trichogramma brassicae TaxID=86971 RepID=A0A6H5I0X8_9HYME|nr:unnamed protein product [Trichogramma brassicae]
MSMSSNQSGENFHGEGGTHVEKLKRLKCVYGNANWAIEALRHGFLRQLHELILNWKGQLPNLRNIFRKDEINDFLKDSLSCCAVNNNYQGELFIDFVARSGYKYEPDVDKDGKPLLRLDTAVHCAARLNCSKDLIGKLFQIYNYGIDFDYIDESGLSHFNVACKYGFENIVEKLHELLQDPNNLVKRHKVADFLLT